MLCGPRPLESDSEQAAVRRGPIRVRAKEHAPALGARLTAWVAGPALLGAALGQATHPRPEVCVLLFRRTWSVSILLFQRLCATRPSGRREAAGLATTAIISPQRDPVHGVRQVLGFTELGQPVLDTPKLILNSIGLSRGRHRCRAIMFFFKEARPCVLVQPTRLPFRTASIYHSRCGLWAAGGRAVSWKSTLTAS
jgi:hypothetical protein